MVRDPRHVDCEGGLLRVQRNEPKVANDPVLFPRLPVDKHGLYHVRLVCRRNGVVNVQRSGHDVAPGYYLRGRREGLLVTDKGQQPSDLYRF